VCRKRHTGRERGDRGQPGVNIFRMVPIYVPDPAFKNLRRRRACFVEQVTHLGNGARSWQWPFQAFTGERLAGRGGLGLSAAVLSSAGRDAAWTWRRSPMEGHGASRGRPQSVASEEKFRRRFDNDVLVG